MRVQHGLVGTSPSSTFTKPFSRLAQTPRYRVVKVHQLRFWQNPIGMKNVAVMAGWRETSMISANILQEGDAGSYPHAKTLFCKHVSTAILASWTTYTSIFKYSDIGMIVENHVGSVEESIRKYLFT
ncbi:hypothetical protein QQP08_004773 [Theobroma cacao]|nr:hypothetical protein QQP08_004773 [Theobroma cacao]